MTSLGYLWLLLGAHVLVGNPMRSQELLLGETRKRSATAMDSLYPATRQKSPEPVVSGPVDSIRWEMIREGVEDYDIFPMLADAAKRARNAGKAPDLVRNAERALRDVRALCPSLVEYETDPWKLYCVREQAAVALEGLVRAGFPSEGPGAD